MNVQNSNLFLLLILYSFSGQVLSQNSPCDSGWEPYKDEKCLRIFDTPGLLNYSDAEDYCYKQGDSRLISIGFEEKQAFLENFLRTQNVVDNVWLGLKYNDDGTYRWSDETEYHYSNWAPGSPKMDPDYCVQIQTDDPEYGNWSDVQCSKKNAVICERLQLWSAAYLQTTVLNIMKNPFPIGFIYVQFPNERSPQEIWSWMNWQDISPAYAGVFFRVEGGNSLPFENNTVQEEYSPRLIAAHTAEVAEAPWGVDVAVTPGVLSDPILTGRGPDQANWLGVQFTVSDGEVRPANMAIRIWKRLG